MSNTPTERVQPKLPDRKTAGKGGPARSGSGAAGGGEAATHTPVPVLVRLADVEPEPIRWLWPGRMAIGKLTLDVAARVSRGAPWPDQPDGAAPIGAVVLLSAEDDIGDTIRPRLDAAGADVTRIAALTAVRGRDAEGDYSRPVDLSRDLQEVEAATKQVDGCRLVVIDPLTAYLGRTDSHRNAEIRGLLAPLAELAGRQGVAVLAITHLRKGEGPAMYRSMGSLAFVAAARAVWAVAADRDDGTRRLFLPVKNNLAPDQQGLAYQITQGGGVPALAWEPDPVQISADEALGRAAESEQGAAAAEAMDWLRNTLASGRREAEAVKASARRDGIAPRTLDRAKAKLGSSPRPTGSMAGGCGVCRISDRIMGMAKKRPQKLSDQIRRAIETCGKTRYQIAKETGVDAATLCRFVQGKHGLLLENIDRIAECIGMRVVLEKGPKTKKGR